MRGRARSLMPATLVPLAAIVVHQLRFFFAFGAGGSRELSETGHSYLHSLTPWIVLVAALGAGGFLHRLAVALRDGDPGQPRRGSTLRLWIVASATLIFIYVGQELLEGLLATGHPDGLAGVFGDGGWWAIPAALAVGAVLALLVRGGRAAIAFVADRRSRSVRDPRRRALRRPAPVFVCRPRPLASCAPGRAPPRAVS